MDITDENLKHSIENQVKTEKVKEDMIKDVTVTDEEIQTIL